MAPTVPIDYSEQRVILAVSTICIVIPSVLIGLRALAKMRARGKLDASDYCILAALVCSVTPVRKKASKHESRRLTSVS